MVWTHLAISTLGTSHHEAGVRQVALAVLCAVDVGTSALHLDATRLDGGVNGYGISAFGLLGSTVALDFTALGIAWQR